MSFVVEPSAIESGVVTAPGDKSISHRALMLGAAANGTTSISGFLAGEDCLATAGALRSMGVIIEQPKDTEVLVHGNGLADWTEPAGPIDLGNSG
ncbi:MAG: 3-phosphoshikimate 1-carboxyvinyltransferase, partial [Woeseiaceae bacterium]|nr:3-phosphoshikimate 1-carboxyvinyltransferase [Woeseiaceae bacterium]